MTDTNSALPEPVKEQQLTDAEKQVIQDAQALAEAERQLAIVNLRALHPQKVLSPKQYRTLLSLSEEEQTEEDKTRLAWASLRLVKHRYNGTDYTPAEKKKVKAKRRTAKASRKKNR